MIMSVKKVRFNKEMVMTYFKVRYGTLQETLEENHKELTQDKQHPVWDFNWVY